MRWSNTWANCPYWGMVVNPFSQALKTLSVWIPRMRCFSHITITWYHMYKESEWIPTDLKVFGLGTVHRQSWFTEKPWIIPWFATTGIATHSLCESIFLCENGRLEDEWKPLKWWCSITMLIYWRMVVLYHLYTCVKHKQSASTILNHNSTRIINHEPWPTTIFQVHVSHIPRYPHAIPNRRGVHRTVLYHSHIV